MNKNNNIDIKSKENVDLFKNKRKYNDLIKEDKSNAHLYQTPVSANHFYGDNGQYYNNTKKFKYN